MSQLRLLRQATLMVGIFFGLFCLAFAQNAEAQQTNISTESRKAFASLCSELKKINTTNSKKLYADCQKSYIKKADQDKVVGNICAAYGKGSLKDDCANYQPSSSKPTSGDSALTGGSSSISLGEAGKYQCGKKDGNKGAVVNTKFNFGCLGPNYPGAYVNPILDLAFSIIRFVSAGVGLIVVGSIIYAGILYSSSQGNPEQTQAAKNRIQNSIIGLVLYIFIFALVQYLVPGGLFK